MDGIDLLQLNSTREFLAEVFAQRRQRSADFTLRQWAGELGYKTPSMLSDMMRGRRKVKPPVLSRILQHEQISGRPAQYLNLLCFLENARAEEERQHLLAQIEQLDGVSQQDTLALSRFKLMTEWYHWAILELVEQLTVGPADLAVIQRHLQPRVTLATIKLALDRLERLGVIQVRKGRLRKVSEDLWINHEVPNEAIRDHHREFMRLAQAALEQPFHRRHISGTQISVNHETYPELLALIQEFHHRLHQLDAGPAGEDVYRVNFQAFPLTHERPDHEPSD